jgi:hypothetical protein
VLAQEAAMPPGAKVDELVFIKKAENIEKKVMKKDNTQAISMYLL